MADNEDLEPRRHCDPEEWTPQQGLVRAAIWGVGTAAVLAALLAPVAWFAPAILMSLLVRIVLGVALVWILLGTVQSAGGFAGWPITALGIILSALVLASNHVVFAVHGVPGHDGPVAGWGWLQLPVLGVVNAGPLFAVCAVAVLCHRGVPGGALTDFLMTRPGQGG
jgi:hypothetical protein